MAGFSLLALWLIAAILLVVLATVLLDKFKVGDPERTVILVLLLLGIVLFFGRQFGAW